MEDPTKTNLRIIEEGTSEERMIKLSKSLMIAERIVKQALLTAEAFSNKSNFEQGSKIKTLAYTKEGARK